VEKFGPYEVYECLGKGGMATVHRAKKPGIEGFERVDALKRLLPHLELDEAFVRSFVYEAKLAAQLRHSNIVQIHDLGCVDGRYYIAMEYLEGRTVQEILQRARTAAGPLPIDVFASIFGELCDALEHAHGRDDLARDDGTGIVHADVSPSNLIVSEAGHLKVIDFGLARATSPAQQRRGVFVAGKLGYMSPEAMTGIPLTACSDVFSAAVIAHELLTAQPLFPRTDRKAILTRLEQGMLPSPSAFNSACPVGLDDIIMTALDPDPTRRFESIGAMRYALDQLMHSLKIAPSRRQVSMWLEFAFADDISQVRELAVGSRRTMPLPAMPETIAPRPPTAPPVPDADDEAPTRRSWKALVTDDGAPALVTESAETEGVVREARSASGSGPLPKIASPPPQPDLVPRITFRPATIPPPGAEEDD